MAADLHIHVRTPEMTDDVMRMFFSSTIGDSKWCVPFPDENMDEETTGRMMDEWWNAREKLDIMRKEWEANHPEYRHGLHELFGESPNVWVGEVSWLKAALMEGGEEVFVPNVVAEIYALMDGAIINDELIAKVREAFSLDNSTYYTIANVDDVVNFLEEHKGKETFTISW